MSIAVESLFKARTFSVFNDSEHIQALIEILSDPLQDTSDVADFILTAVDIDSAEGEQLEFIGRLIGVERPPAQEVYIATMVRIGEDQDPDEGFADDENPGGYMTTLSGLESISDPDAEMSDEDFRFYIWQKATAYRAKMTREVLFLYLIAFGARCKIDDDSELQVFIDMDTYDDFNEWTRNYVETRGFNPGGISVKILETTRHKEAI